MSRLLRAFLLYFCNTFILLQASHLPLSIIIVGVGNADFTGNSLRILLREVQSLLVCTFDRLMKFIRSYQC